MSDTNRVSLAYAEESSYGAIPSGAYTYLRYTGESLAEEATFKRSEEIRADRMIDDIPRVDVKTGGSINHELSADAYDFAMTYGLQYLGVAVSTTPGTSLTVASATTITRASGSFVTDGYEVGDWVQISQHPTAANNGFYRVTAVVALTLTVTGGLTIAAASTAMILEAGTKYKTGTYFKTLTFLKTFTDLSNMFAVFAGCGCDQLAYKCSAQNFITLVTTWMGKAETAPGATPAGSMVNAPTNIVLEAVDHVPILLRDWNPENAGGAYAGTPQGMIELTWQLQNNLRGRMEIAALGPVSLGVGSINTTGTMRLYFSTLTVYNYFLNNSWTSLCQASLSQDPLQSTRKVGYIFDFPKVKLTKGTRVAGGKDQDVIADFTWEAVRSVTFNCHMKVQSFL